MFACLDPKCRDCASFWDVQLGITTTETGTEPVSIDGSSTDTSLDPDRWWD